VTAKKKPKKPSGPVPRDEPEQGIDGYGGKKFGKRKVLIAINLENGS